MSRRKEKQAQQREERERGGGLVFTTGYRDSRWRDALRQETKLIASVTAELSKETVCLSVCPARRYNNCSSFVHYNDLSFVHLYMCKMKY